MAVSLLEEQGTALLFSLPSTDGELRSLLLKSPFDTIESGLFPFLRTLRVQNPCRVSDLQLTGALLGRDNRTGVCMCSSSLSPDTIAELCLEAVSYNRVYDFLKLCGHFYPLLEVVDLKQGPKQNANLSVTVESVSKKNIVIQENEESEEIEKHDRKVAQDAASMIITDLRRSFMEYRAGSHTETASVTSAANSDNYLYYGEGDQNDINSNTILQQWYNGLRQLGVWGPECEAISARIEAAALLRPSSEETGHEYSTTFSHENYDINNQQVVEATVFTQRSDTRLLMDARACVEKCMLKKNHFSRTLNFSTAPIDDIMHIQKTHAWCILALAEALGARRVALEVVVAIMDTYVDADSTCVPSGWSEKMTLKAVSSLLQHENYIRYELNMMRKQQQETRYDTQLREKHENQPTIKSRFNHHSYAECNSDTSSDDACTDDDVEEESIWLESPTSNENNIQNKNDGMLWLPPPLPHEVLQKDQICSKLSSQRDNNKDYNQPSPMPSSGQTTAENSPIDEREPRTPVRSGSHIDNLSTPCSALSTASSRRNYHRRCKNRANSPSTTFATSDDMQSVPSPLHGDGEIEQILTSHRGVELLNRACPRPPTPSALKVDTSTTTAVSVNETSRISTESAIAARNAAAQRVRAHRYKQVASEQAEAAAVATKSARLQMLAVEASHARRLTPKLITKDLTYQKKKTAYEADQRRLEAEQKFNVKQSQAEIAQKRAAQRVKERRTHALTSNERQILSNLENIPSPVLPLMAEKSNESIPKNIVAWDHSDTGKTTLQNSLTSTSPHNQWVLEITDKKHTSIMLKPTKVSDDVPKVCKAVGAPETLLLGCNINETIVDQCLFPPSPKAKLSIGEKANHVDICTLETQETNKKLSISSLNEDDDVQNEVTQAAAAPVYMQVHRAWALPETLSGCSPYIELSWGSLGRARTDTVLNTTEPEYGSHQNDDGNSISNNNFLKFRSPILCNGPSVDLLVALGEDIHIQWPPIRKEVPVFLPPLKVNAFSSNNCVSDEWLGEGEVDSQLLVEQYSSKHTVALFDSKREPAGVVELQFAFGLDEN